MMHHYSTISFFASTRHVCLCGNALYQHTQKLFQTLPDQSWKLLASAKTSRFWKYSQIGLYYDVMPQTDFPHHCPLCRESTDYCELIYWGWVTNICISKLIIIGSDNGLSPGRRQAIIWTNAGILLIGPPGTTFHEIWLKLLHFHSRKSIL